MAQTLSVLPAPFWVLMLVLAGGVLLGIGRIRDGLGLPLLAVLGTVGAWYVGDALYNNYAANHAQLFPPEILAAAWWQVVLFCGVFLVLAPSFHHWWSRRLIHQGSYAVYLFQHGPGDADLQQQLTLLFRVCAIVWAVLTVLGTLRLKGEILYYFFPFLSYRADPWARGRVGAGIDFLLIAGSYLHLLVGACFGVVAAVSKDKRIRFLALLGCALTWPYIAFGSARNYMLTVAVPGILAWVLLRVRAILPIKLALLAACFMAISLWLAFVIANRSTTSVVEAAKEGAVLSEETREARHEGLNMYEELCWINSFIAEGSYEPNRGKRYWAELVNPIPRTLWNGKPMIGIDYSVLRGQARDVGDDTEAAGVYATISTGMIGQGVVNFGPYVGSAFAAALMAAWAAVLARFDLSGRKFGRIPLYGIGLMLTFNLGRDITFITLYPFVFGAALIWVIQRWERPAGDPAPERAPRKLRKKGRQGSLLQGLPKQSAPETPQL